MATQPTTQTLQSVHPIPNRIPVFIPDPLVADLAEMYAAIGGQRAMSFYKFVSQLVVDHIVRYRSMRIKPTSAVSAFDEEGEAAEQTEDNYIHKRALTPEQAQTVLHLRFSQGMSVANIAARLNRSRSTIRRVCVAYEEHEHHPSAIQPGPNRPRGDSDWDNA